MNYLSKCILDEYRLGDTVLKNIEVMFIDYVKAGTKARVYLNSVVITVDKNKLKRVEN